MNAVKLEELVSKYANGKATDEEVAELMHWYRSQQIGDVNWPSDAPEEAHTLRLRMLEKLRQEVQPQQAKIVHFSWMRAAAIIMLFLGIASLLYFIIPSPQQYITVTNPTGKIQLVHLPDSSKVWLNASTELRYAKNFKADRNLQLEGEAYFEVKPDKAHPFRVQAGKVETTVVGTAFNVNAYPSDNVTTVSVTSGIVSVATGSEKPAVLNASMEFQLDKNTGRLSTSTIDTSSIVAWKEGRLQFHGLAMHEISRRLQNWYGYTIILSKPGMANCRYYMTFKNSLSVEQLFSAMSEVAEMKYIINHESKTVTLTGTECK